MDGHLTPPSSRRPPAGCAGLRSPLMSNLRHHEPAQRKSRLWARLPSYAHLPQDSDHGKINKTNGSLVKVVVSDGTGKWVSPAATASFAIDAAVVFVVSISRSIPQCRAQRRGAEASREQREPADGVSQPSAARHCASSPTKGNFFSGDKKVRAELGKVIGGKP